MDVTGEQESANFQSIRRELSAIELRSFTRAGGAHARGFAEIPAHPIECEEKRQSGTIQTATL
jgi:hypothetical protein